MTTKTLDLGCGWQVKNPFNADQTYGIDFKHNPEINVISADLNTDPIPFESDYFDYVTAYDFIEHVPRIVYTPHRRFCFVELMNEIYRVLKPQGIFYSCTPAWPSSEVNRDPTHVNIITDETFPLYFDNKTRWAAMYGFNGAFEIVNQKWHENKIYLLTTMRKVEIG